jgi:predicted transcriptional regulator
VQAQADPQRTALHARPPDLAPLLQRGAAATGREPAAFTGGRRTHAIARVRDGRASLWVVVLGRSARARARALGLQPASAYRAARRGASGRVGAARRGLGGSDTRLILLQCLNDHSH